MENEIKYLYSYIMTCDTGFAPNPFNNICTLACCKSSMRLSITNKILQNYKKDFKDKSNIKRLTKKYGDFDLQRVKKEDQNFIRNQKIWIVGVIGKDLAKKYNINRIHNILFVMQVTNILTYDEYSKEINFKIPQSDFFNVDRKDYGKENSDYKNCGDNIYYFDDEKKSFNQRPSFHQTKNNFDENTLNHDISGKYILLSDKYVYFGENVNVKYDPMFKNKQKYSVKTCDELDDKLKIKILKIMESSFNILGRPIESSLDFNWED